MNLKTIIFVFGALVLLATLASGQSLPYNKLDKLKVNDLVAKKLEVQSTTQSSLPCPSMTQVQRDAIATPTEGSCVYNSDTNVLNIYDGSAWVEVGSGGGGAGGIANWETAKFYEVSDVVIESNKIYQANTQHTSSVFASDIAYWTQIANNVSDVTGVLPMANGGTDKNLTPVLGGVVYTDAGSMEILGAGTTGQFLKSNGGAAPSWEDVVVNDSSFSGLLSLSKGGTNKNLSAEDGAILYLDADSVEKLSPGTSGQVLQSNGAGAPSFANKSISAKSENGPSVTLEEIQVSNNLLTQTDTNKHLIESGNNNILVNPSFEHSTFSTGWTNTNGVFAEDTIVELHGKKAAKVTLTAQALSLHQDSTLYQSQFADGVQGLASVRVKTLVSGIKVCSKQAGIITSNLCVDVQANNKWGLYKVPFILGGTSNGISINSNSTNVTGDVYIEDAFVGAASLTQNMNACQSVNCETTFSASVSATGVISNENMNWINGNAVITDLSLFTISFNSSIFTVAPNCVVTEESASTAVDILARLSIPVTSTTLVVRTNASDAGTSFSKQPYPFTIVCQKQGADFTAAKQLSNGNTYSSTNADTDWASCGHTTSSFTGFGTVTGIETQCKRQGSDLLMKGKFNSVSPTTVEARLSLPLWNGVQLISAGSSIIPSLQLAGDAVRNNQGSTTFRNSMLIEPSVSYLTFGFQSSTTNALTKQTGSNTVASGDNLSFNARIPIAGWDNSNIIIGQFNGLESCTNTLECTDTFSAKISSVGVVSGENLDWLDGNCSNPTTGTYNCTIKTGIFTAIPNCTATAEGAVGGPNTAMLNITSATALSAYLRNTSNGVQSSTWNLICQKQGVDFVSKTAKAVASDQNLRSPGLTRAVVNSCLWTSAGAFNNPVMCNAGFSSMSKPATGRYQLNFARTQANDPVCVANNTNVGADRMCNIYSISTSNVTVQCENSSAGTDIDVPGLVICHGVE